MFWWLCCICMVSCINATTPKMAQDVQCAHTQSQEKATKCEGFGIFSICNVCLFLPQAILSQNPMTQCPAWPRLQWVCPSSCSPPPPAWSSSPGSTPVNHKGKKKRLLTFYPCICFWAPIFTGVTSYVYLYAHDINKLIAVQDRHHFKHSECYQPIKAVATCSYYYNK